MVEYITGEIINGLPYPKNLAIIPSTWLLVVVETTTNQISNYITKYISIDTESNDYDPRDLQLLTGIINRDNPGPAPEDWETFYFIKQEEFSTFNQAQCFIKNKILNFNKNPDKEIRKRKSSTKSSSNQANNVTVSVEMNQTSPIEMNQNSPGIPSQTKHQLIPEQETLDKVINNSKNSLENSHPTSKVSRSNELNNNDTVLILNAINNLHQNVENKFNAVEQNMNKLNTKIKNIENNFQKLLTISTNNFDEVGNVKIMLNSILKEKLTDYMTVEDFQKKYNLSIPFKELEEFEKFNYTTIEDTQLKSDLFKMFENFLVVKDGLQPSIKNILKVFLELNVMDMYNAQKTLNLENKGNTENVKNIFCECAFSKSLEVCAQNIFGEDGTSKKYRSALSKTFNNSRDWGNRKNLRINRKSRENQEQ